MRKVREPKEGAKGRCQNCGDKIIVTSKRHGEFRVRWYNTWVHEFDYEVRCHYWTARPMSHRKSRRPTIFEQLTELYTLRYRTRVIEPILRGEEPDPELAFSESTP